MTERIEIKSWREYQSDAAESLKKDWKATLENTVIDSNEYFTVSW